MTLISTSILSIHDNISTKINELNETTTDYFHIDIMDGYFVPHKSFTIHDIKKLNINKKLDVHLMVKDPVRYIKIHYELNQDLKKLLQMIHNYGIKCGLSIKPNTDISLIYDYLPLIDLILIMSVEPGTGGQTFLDSTYRKISTLKDYLTRHSLQPIIAVDGGINDINSKTLINLGVDMLVAGSFITNSSNFQAQIDKLRS